MCAALVLLVGSWALASWQVVALSLFSLCGRASTDVRCIARPALLQLTELSPVRMHGMGSADPSAAAPETCAPGFVVTLKAEQCTGWCKPCFGMLDAWVLNQPANTWLCLVFAKSILQGCWGMHIRLHVWEP